MFHRTTINFHWKTKALLDFLHEKTGLSRRKIVLLIIGRIIDGKHGVRVNHLDQICYQESDPGKKKWKKFHIAFTFCEYEYFIDIRHLFRESSSRLISAALWEFASDFLDGSFNDWDSSLVVHAVESFFDDNVQVWVQYWGIPRRLFDDRDNSARVT